MTPDQAAMLEHANEELIDAALARIRDHAQTLFERGATIEEVNVILRAYVIDLERWRVSAFRRIKRYIDEPRAPSLEVH